MTIRPCAIIPTYNHSQVIEEIVVSLRALKLPVFIVDDGSAEKHRHVIAALHAPDQGVTVLRCETNGGKGAAVHHGLELAQKAGYSHAVQLDADGQHDRTVLPDILALSKDYPQALMSGVPVYDESIPKSRLIARYLTHVWVWVETLSFQIKDSMCGFRVYPVADALRVLQEEKIGRHMDFDTEIMVHLFWRGIPVIKIPVGVTYPEGNTSNFQLLADNWRITKMHTRLVFTMLWRLPSILRNRPPKIDPHDNKSWASIEERGMAWGLAFLATTYRLLGYRVCWIVMQPILFYFFLTGRVQRQASRLYWEKMNPLIGDEAKVSFWRLWRHTQSFGRMALDKFSAWVGDVAVSDLKIPNIQELDHVVAEKQGVLVITSHLGNVEICRALSDRDGYVPMTVFAYTANAVKFNQLLAKYNPRAMVNVIEVGDMGPATAIELQDRLDHGEWVIIAGDRTPVTGDKRVSYIPFLGQEAPFSHGPILLGHLLKCPVYSLICLRDGDHFEVHFDLLFDQITLDRKNKNTSIDEYLFSYAQNLENYAKKKPMQWFNFIDFWREME